MSFSELFYIYVYSASYVKITSDPCWFCLFYSIAFFNSFAWKVIIWWNIPNTFLSMMSLNHLNPESYKVFSPRLMIWDENLIQRSYIWLINYVSYLRIILRLSMICHAFLKWSLRRNYWDTPTKSRSAVIIYINFIDFKMQMQIIKLL